MRLCGGTSCIAGSMNKSCPQRYSAARHGSLSRLSRTLCRRSRSRATSMKLAYLYARLNPETLERDLKWLLEEGLVVRALGGYAANPEMQPFVAPRALVSRL